MLAANATGISAGDISPAAAAMNRGLSGAFASLLGMLLPQLPPPPDAPGLKALFPSVGQAVSAACPEPKAPAPAQAAKTACATEGLVSGAAKTADANAQTIPVFASAGPSLPAPAQAAKTACATDALLPVPPASSPEPKPSAKVKAAKAADAKEQTGLMDSAIAIPVFAYAETNLPAPAQAAKAACATEPDAKRPAIPLLPKAPSGDIAFAVKLTPAPSPVEKPAEAPVKVLPTHEIPRPVETVAVPHMPTPPPTETSAHKPEIRQTPRLPEPPPEPAVAKPLESLRDISFKLTGTQKEPVEVRLLERAGELRVSVRSADTQLNTDLRTGLGDLAGKLERTGFHTETWHPGDQESTPDRRQHPEHRQERRDPPPPRPEWVEEIANRISTGEQMQ